MSAAEHGERIIASADAYARAHAHDQYSPHARIARDAVKTDITTLVEQLASAVKRYDELLTWLHVAHRHPGDVQTCAACVIAVQLAHDTTATRERGA